MRDPPRRPPAPPGSSLLLPQGNTSALETPARGRTAARGGGRRFSGVQAATLMLANAAEVRDGLIYVLGGGIEQLWVAELPTDVAPTVVLSVEPERDELGRPFTPHLRVTSDSGHVLVDVAMPPAIPEPRGAEAAGAHRFRFPMVFTVGMHVLGEGGHRLSVEVDGEELAGADFAVRLAGR